MMADRASRNGRSFLRELVRRKVLRVGITYVVLAIATVEAADLMFPRLGLPDWTITLVLGLAIVGLPLAIGLAWAFQITDRGLERESEVLEEGVPEPQRDAPWSLSADTPHRSIAVLPFDDMSPGRDQAYLADGLAEEILNGLSRLSDLNVVARTSSFLYRGGGHSVGEVGRKLGVAHVLEGSVRKWGDRIRVTAQLVGVEDGFHLWSEVFDRHLDDIFAIQDEIARAIVEKMNVKLLEEEKGGIFRELTDDPMAFDLYLKGRHAWYNRYRVGLETALGYFQRALERDPDFVLPLCGIADTYTVLGMYGLLHPAEARRACENAVGRAMELDPDLPEVRFSEALVTTVFPRFDELGELIWPDAKLKAVWELKPDFAEAAGWYGLAHVARGGVGGCGTAPVGRSDWIDRTRLSVHGERGGSHAVLGWAA